MLHEKDHTGLEIDNSRPENSIKQAAQVAYDLNMQFSLLGLVSGSFQHRHPWKILSALQPGD